jgi:hypothetical protein
MGSPQTVERADPLTADPAATIQTLMNTVAKMQESINALTLKLMKQDKFDIPGAPRMEKTDIQDTTPFNGAGFTDWSENFIAHLRLRDSRWEPLLKGIKERSKQPVSEMDGDALMAEASIKDNAVLQIFQQQLYEYLKRFTAGEPSTYVQAGGPEGAFEAWRRLCDQGASRRDRSMRGERRNIWHPAPVKDASLLAGIESWEKKLAAYLRVRRDDSMSVADKLMALEDMCAPHLQRHLATLEAQGQITSEGDNAYAQHKAALEQWFQDEKRWGKKGALNAFADAPVVAEKPEEPEHPEQPDYGGEYEEPGDSYDPFMQQLFALVNNRFNKKGKGKGKGKKGKGKTGDGEGDVDMGGDTRPGKGKGKGNGNTCYDCGEEGHYGRDCPQRKARVAAGGPVFKDKPGRDNGSWPSQKEWKGMYPGPSPTQWNGWYPQKGLGKSGGSANLLTAASPLAALFQPGKMYAFTEKRREPQQNRYKALGLSGSFNAGAECRDGDDCKCGVTHDEDAPSNNQVITPIIVNIEDLVKKPSRNAMKKMHRAERQLAVKFQDDADNSAMDDAMECNRPTLEPQPRHPPGNAPEFAEIDLAKYVGGELELNQGDSLAERENAA